MKKYLLTFLALGILLLLYLLLAPPRWYLNLTKRVDVSPEVGAALVEKHDCCSCHVIGGEGAFKSPNLDTAVQSKTLSTLGAWLANPRNMETNTAMPNVRLSDSEMEAILSFLARPTENALI